MPIQELLEYMLVFRKAVRPEIKPHEPACCPQVILHERHGHFSRGCVAQPCERNSFRLLERLHECSRQPGMRLRECPFHAEGMHDRKQLRLSVPICRALVRIVEEVPDLRMSLVKA